MKSRYRYSAGIVYNNFPWPEKINAQQKSAIEKQTQKVLDVRKQYKDKTWAWMYNPETMPADLKKAHDELDGAVDEGYGFDGERSDETRVAFLFSFNRTRKH